MLFDQQAYNIHPILFDVKEHFPDLEPTREVYIVSLVHIQQL